VGRGASPFKSCIEDTGLSFVAKMPLCSSVGANARARLERLDRKNGLTRDTCELQRYPIPQYIT